VRQLRDTGASLRNIATTLGISKDTVRRDLNHPSRTPDQQNATPTPSLRQRVAQRNETAFTTLGQLTEAVSAVESQRVGQLLINATVARQIETTLRQHAATLLTIADQIREQHPDTNPKEQQ
jgi:IS30 family transposase